MQPELSLQADDAAFRIDDILGVSALEQLRAEWDALWRELPDATPFQSPSWLIPWWRHIGEGELLVLALRDREERLVGVLPLYRYRPRADDQQRLLPLGIGTTDYLDILLRPGLEKADLALVSGHLARLAGDAIWDWPQLRPGSSMLSLPTPAGWTDQLGDAEPCPCLFLPASLADMAGRVSAKTLRDWRTARRRADQAGQLRWETESDGVEAPFEALCQLHAARWDTRGEPGVLASPSVQSAHREALPALHQDGLLRFHVLKIDGRIVAVLYALADPPQRSERRLYLYLSGFDPAWERISPGMLLVGRAIAAAIAEGFTIVDFLRGRERYKYFWGAQDQTCYHRRLVPPDQGSLPCAAC